MTESKTDSERLSKARSYKEAHRDSIKKWQDKYNAERLSDPVRRAKKLEQDKASRKKMSAVRREYDKARDPLKISARNIVRQRIFRGTMKRQSCEKCGLPNAHAHHDDYSKPLDVRWLCPKHHKEAHRV